MRRPPNGTEAARAASPRPRSKHGLTVRLRLTLTYGLLFLAAGTVLLAFNYFLVRHSLTDRPNEVRAAVAARLGLSPDQVRADRQVAPPSMPDSSRALLFRDAQREFVNESLHQLLEKSGIALGAMALGSVALGWYMAGRVLRPVKNMTATAKRLSEQNLHERVALPGPRDELTELGDTFDEMLERLDTAFDTQRRFVADASHELRTPLSVIRTEVDVTLADPDATNEDLRNMAQVVRESTIRTERLIDSLLTLARTDSAVVRLDRVDLAAVARSALERTASQAEDRELGVDLSIRPGWVRGDRTLLEHLARNLVDNAIRYNVQSGFVAVAVGTTDHTSTLHITNSGPIIPEHDVDRLTQRFHGGTRTSHESPNGSGLGLSIVDAVSKVHAAHLTLNARSEGGLDVLIEFPAAPNGDEATHGVAVAGQS
jgi:signal transduction histidine kinase